METVPSPGIGAAILILLNLLYFVLIVLAVSLLIENVWIGRSRWIVFPLVVSLIAIFSFHPCLFLRILDAVTGPFSFKGFLTITGSGVLAGMAMSSL